MNRDQLRDIELTLELPEYSQVPFFLPELLRSHQRLLDRHEEVENENVRLKRLGAEFADLLAEAEITRQRLAAALADAREELEVTEKQLADTKLGRDVIVRMLRRLSGDMMTPEEFVAAVNAVDAQRHQS